MTFNVQIRPPKHRCNLGSAYARHGEIVECSGCGRWWRAYEPGNPPYAKWVRAWIQQCMRRLFNIHSPSAEITGRCWCQKTRRSKGMRRIPKPTPVPKACPNCTNPNVQYHSLTAWCMKCGWGKNRYSDADMKIVRSMRI